MAKPKNTSRSTANKKTKASRTAADTKSKAALEPKVNEQAATTPTAAVRLPAAWAIAKKAFATVWAHRWLFLGITAIYMALNIFLVRGFNDVSNLTQLESLLNDEMFNDISGFTRNVALVAFLITNAGDNSTEMGAVYQGILLLIASLAIVWAIRQVSTGTKVRIRDAFYKGMYPLIPVILILLVVVLGTLPLVLSATIYSLLSDGGVIVTGVEQVLWVLLLLLGASLTLYFLSTSITALYIATLPDMTPMKALRSARELVRGRRMAVIRKMLFLPVLVLVVGVIILLPVIAVWTAAAPWVFYALSMVGIVVLHAYLYTLYRELLV